MVAGLLYLIGLLVTLASIALAGYNLPTTIKSFTTAMDSGTANMVDVTLTLAAGYTTTFGWIIGGLLLMAAGRVIMLLGAINRSLRGQN